MFVVDTPFHQILCLLLCDEKAAPRGAVGASAGNGDEVLGPGGVGDHSGGL